MAQSIKVTQSPKIKVVLVTDDTISYTLEVWPKMRNVVITPVAAPSATNHVVYLTVLGSG